jgi:hypothetical protein
MSSDFFQFFLRPKVLENIRGTIFLFVNLIEISFSEFFFQIFIIQNCQKKTKKPHVMSE